MKKDITNFIRRMCEKYNLEANYFPLKDVYSIRFKGRGVQNFTSKTYYTLPKRHRENMLLALVKIGLNHNVGQQNLKNSIYQNRNLGKKIA